MNRRGFLRLGLAGSVLAAAGASFDPLARSQAAEQARSLNLKTTDLKTFVVDACLYEHSQCHDPGNQQRSHIKAFCASV